MAVSGVESNGVLGKSLSGITVYLGYGISVGCLAYRPYLCAEGTFSFHGLKEFMC